MSIIEKLYEMRFIDRFQKTRKGYIITFALPDRFNLKAFKDFFKPYGLEIEDVTVEPALLGYSVTISLRGIQDAEE